MHFLNKSISTLRKISLYLFLVPSIALLVTLLLHNLLVGFNFTSSQEKFEKLPLLINCNKENNFCLKGDIIETSSFEECQKNIVDHYILIENNKYNIDDYKNKYLVEKKYDENQLIDLNIKIVYFKTELLNNNCILNSDFLTIYKIFPNLFYSVERIKKNKKYNPATSEMVNPFIYGEASISNIVKRYPINFIFKPLLYISSILMIFYWICYNKIFNNTTKNSKLNKFTIFGIASSIFLFFHVLLLGSEIDNEIFNKIRRLNLVLFIICEISAQFFLTRSLYISYAKLSDLIHRIILNLKIFFVSITLITTIVILTILSFYNLESKIDYILEWNYFLFLLVFYFLSAIMWKKNN